MFLALLELKEVGPASSLILAPCNTPKPINFHSYSMFVLQIYKSFVAFYQLHPILKKNCITKYTIKAFVSVRSDEASIVASLR